MKHIENIAAVLSLFSLVSLPIVLIAGIWEVIDFPLFTKIVSTNLVVFVAGVIVMVGTN